MKKKLLLLKFRRINDLTIPPSKNAQNLDFLHVNLRLL